MENRTLLDLSDEQFKTLIDNYIERGSQDTDDFDLEGPNSDALANFMEGLSEEVTLEVKGTWHNGHFRLAPKGPVPTDVQVQIVGNRIALPGITFIIQPEDEISPNGSISETQSRAFVY